MKALSLRRTGGPSNVHVTPDLQERIDDACDFVHSFCEGVTYS
jgi:hypothetical protein